MTILISLSPQILWTVIHFHCKIIQIFFPHFLLFCSVESFGQFIIAIANLRKGPLVSAREMHWERLIYQWYLHLDMF